MANNISDSLKGNPKGKFLKLLMSRKSTYAYSERKLSEADLRTILEAGRWSPSFRNLQPWEFVVVRNKGAIRKLLESAHYGLYSFDKHGSLPPAAIALVLKKKYWQGEFGFPDTDKAGVFEAYMSIAMPAMNMMLCAQDMGIASCILNVRESLSCKQLRVQGADTVPIIVCFGYPKSGFPEEKRARKPLKDIVCFEFCDPKKA